VSFVFLLGGSGAKVVHHFVQRVREVTGTASSPRHSH
jgi:hypothetical protein